MSSDAAAEVWIEDQRASVAFQGLVFGVRGWARRPEVEADPDEIRVFGPAADNPDVQLEVRHTFDRTWQIRINATATLATDWAGAALQLGRYGPVGEGLLPGTEGDEQPPRPWPPVWSWCLGAEAHLMAADAFDGPVMVGTLRRGSTLALGDDLVIPPGRVTREAPITTTWSIEEVSGVAAAHGMLPAWLPVATGLTMTDELSLHAPDHGLVIDPDLVTIESDGVTRIGAGGRTGISEILLHGARGTIGLPIAFAPALSDAIRDLAAARVEMHHGHLRPRLGPGEAMVLSVGASAGVRHAATVLERAAIDSGRPHGVDLPLLVGAFAMELARTGDPRWADELAEAADQLTPTPGAGTALLRAVIGTFAVDGDPQPYLDRMSALEGPMAGRFDSPEDAIVALEVAAIGGWAEATQVERVAALLGWGLPLGPGNPVNRVTVAQAAAALTMVDEHLVRDWPVSPSVIAEQATRWLIAEQLPAEVPELLAWLVLPVVP